MDEHAPEAITVGLRRRDVDVHTVIADGLAGSSDPDVLERATALGRDLYTQDVNFLGVAKTRQDAGISFPGVIHCHQLHLTISHQVYELELVAKCSDPSE